MMRVPSATTTAEPARPLGQFAVVLERDLDIRVGLASSPEEAVLALDAIDGELAELRAEVADRRAAVIARVAGERSTRTAARIFGISPAAVAKAVRRAGGGS